MTICRRPDCLDARSKAARVQGLLQQLALLRRRAERVEGEMAAERAARMRADRRSMLDREALEQMRARLAERDRALNEQNERLLFARDQLDDYRHDISLLLAQIAETEARRGAEEETPAALTPPERRRWRIARRNC